MSKPHLPLRLELALWRVHDGMTIGDELAHPLTDKGLITTDTNGYQVVTPTGTRYLEEA